MCSGFHHTQCDCTCACAVACLHPHNPISNVVVSFDMYMYTDMGKNIHTCVASWCEESAQTIPGHMDKSVAKENNQLSHKLEPQEVDSLVQTSRRNDGAHACVSSTI